LRGSTNPQAQFVWAVLRNTFHYAALTRQEIADTARDVDFAMRLGLRIKSRVPFEVWQQAGWNEVAGWIAEDIAAGKALAPRAAAGLGHRGPVADRGGVHQPEGSWSPARSVFVPRSSLPVYQRQLFRAPGRRRRPRRPGPPAPRCSRTNRSASGRSEGRASTRC
jgi:3-hydroxyacyl-CoA dehydrogenase